MIKINLLPPERQRADRTPIGRFVLILIGVGLVCFLGAAIGYLEIQIRGQQRRRDELKKDIESPMTAQINLKYAELTARDVAHKSRKSLIENLKAPFRWSDVLDILCDKLETTHKRIWFDTIRVLSMQDIRGRQQKLGSDFQVETGLLVEAQSAGVDPEPYLAFRKDVVGTGEAAVAAKPEGAAPASETAPTAPAAPAAAAPAGASAPSAARRTGKVLIDYFTGGILKVVEFSLKDQSDYEEQFSQSFAVEFYVRKGAAPNR